MVIYHRSFALASLNVLDVVASVLGSTSSAWTPFLLCLGGTEKLDFQVSKAAVGHHMTDGRNRGCLSGVLRYTARPSAGSPGHNSYNQATHPAWLVVF